MMRRLFTIGAILLTATFGAHAQTDLVVRGSGRLYPIGVPQLCLKSGETDAVQAIPETLARDLDISGYFEVLNPNVYIETPGKCAETPEGYAYSDWSVIGAEGLVRGVVIEDDEEIKVQLFLHDVQKQQIVLGKEYDGHRSQARQIAHRFANEVMKFFTGEEGVFGSQISFSSRIGRFKELSVMDMDGSNVRQLTDDRGLALSSSWDPTGRLLVYTSYMQRMPDLFMMDVNDRKVKRVTRGTGLEVGGQFGPDGQTILASQTFGKESHIVLFDYEGRMKRKITAVPGVIDVSPKWSPGYRKIAFCSNRSGGPQIFTMDASGQNVKRISYVSSNYCTSPAWSPLGDRIAFTCRSDGGFQIFSANVDGTDALQLTSLGNNEDPEWAPNGKYITFSSTFGKGPIYNIAIMRFDGSNIKQLTNSRSGSMDPAWGPAPR